MLLRNALLAAAAVAAAAMPAVSQSARWSAPVLDYVYDESSKSLRAVAGVPGAAALEGAVPSAAKLRGAYVAPARKFAIAETIDSGIVLLDWSSREATLRELTGAITEVNAVAFSPRANIAALASRSSGKVQIWSGLPGNPVIRQEIASDASALAVSDDGIVAGVLDDGIYRLDGDSPALLVSGSFSAIAFRPGSSDLAAAGRHNDTVLNVRVGDGEPGVMTLASADDGIAEPVGVRFSRDGAKLAIANQRGRSATILTLDNRSATTVPCDCTPATVAAAAGTAVFRITDSTDQPLMFLDADSAEPRVFLVPVTGGSR